MRYCRGDHSNMYQTNSRVRRSIILIPGSGLDAQNYYNTTLAEATAAGVDPTTIDIIAPFFFSKGNNTHYGLGADYYQWDPNWRYGDASPNKKTSAYAIIDHIVTKLLANRPNLEHIVVAGQSAGGRFVQRYAVGTKHEPARVTMSFWSASEWVRGMSSGVSSDAYPNMCPWSPAPISSTERSWFWPTTDWAISEPLTP